MKTEKEEIKIDKEEIRNIVSSLFADGKTPCDHYGIDAQKITEVELRHPEVAKQIPAK